MLVLFNVSGFILGLCYCCFSQVSFWGCVTAVSVRFNCGIVLLLFQSGLIVGLCLLLFQSGFILGLCYCCFSQV